MTAIKNDIMRLLGITFPELEHITGIFTKSILRLLCHYPSAEAIKIVKRTKIAKILIPISHGRHNDESVTTIMKAAATSIGSASPAKETIIKQKASILIQLEDHLQELTDMLIEQCQAQIKEDIDILTSIGGIGEKSATNFLVELGGDLRVFPSHKQLIAMAGIDPSVYESGKYVGLSKISKRGNRHLRRIIWLMTVKVIQFTEYFRQYFQKRIKDGLVYKKAVLATAHKLIRVIFAMLTNKTLLMQRQVHDPRRNIGMFETYLQKLRLKDERHPDKGRSEKIDSRRFYETGSLAFYPECSKTELNLENQPFLIAKKVKLMIVDCTPH